MRKSWEKNVSQIFSDWAVELTDRDVEEQVFGHLEGTEVGQLPLGPFGEFQSSGLEARGQKVAKEERAESVEVVDRFVVALEAEDGHGPDRVEALVVVPVGHLGEEQLENVLKFLLEVPLGRAQLEHPSEGPARVLLDDLLVVFAAPRQKLRVATVLLNCSVYDPI